MKEKICLKILEIIAWTLISMCFISVGFFIGFKIANTSKETILETTTKNVSSMAISEDVSFEFNALVIDENDNKSYTDLYLSGTIFADTICCCDDFIKFEFSMNSCDEIYNLENSNFCWNLSAYNVETDEIIPIEIYAYEDICICFICTNINPSNVGIVFSGVTNTDEDVVLNDYLLEQECIANSKVAKIKLFS